MSGFKNANSAEAPKRAESISGGKVGFEFTQPVANMLLFLLYRALLAQVSDADASM